MTSIKILTWNILAPCYKRMVTEKSEKVLESQFKSQYMDRSRQIFDMILGQKPDVVCLQEFWFRCPDFTHLFESCFTPQYETFGLQRTGSKADGVMTLISRALQVQEVFPIRFQDAGDRVALLVNATKDGSNFLILNTHLTFHHGPFDTMLRKTQIRKIFESVETYKQSRSISTIPVFIAGDFNGEKSDYVVQYLLERNYRSAYEVQHGGEPTVTHKDHNECEVAVDFIFLLQQPGHPLIKTHSAHLLPHGIPEKNFMEHFKLSDHRPLEVVFEI
eukprot:TRINITY_DN17464_c0_g1_i1.p1 TRINITY_DN17464_c0_g1~~TRINITY_DN17464_c0_g1_i1.p1  ORF type:complete len:275 (-),score=52.18 TRINITY_DN17464_c0_g1_i1:228-1052(-)